MILNNAIREGSYGDYLQVNVWELDDSWYNSDDHEVRHKVYASDLGGITPLTSPGDEYIAASAIFKTLYGD